ncbi:mitochondrial carrier domain-containing protein [Lipomyces tetrasporus]|uniref:Mitochondrial carrier domain-containing protein n=1 Tax=Lipomyces tetrasporus TaxID=54092 RepID=A0AAD7QVR9_9ASCO|nr:mitochondrial carrier domain-containing protein [Lipomyces tetrasporus]KAJ8101751.1 mitochondrial carrier domain-containing protein [Lipomyces tetrasporus]
MDFATISAAVAGSVGSAVVFHPFDTLLTLRQTSISTSYILPFRQYWRGVTISTLLSTPAYALYLVSYRQAKKEFAPYLGADSGLNYVASGVAAEITSSVLFTPMENIKGRLQLKNGSGHESTSELIKNMYKHEGLRSFFRGYWMSLLIYTPNSVFYWYIYENLKNIMRRPSYTELPDEYPASSASSVPISRDLTAAQYAIASSIATVGGESISNFFDIIKTRQQLALSDEIKRMRPDDQHGLLNVAQNLIKEEGIVRALFKGLHIRLMYALPVGVLSMVIVEKLKPDVDDDYEL